MVLLDNREVKKGWQALKDTVSGLFKKHGGEVLSAKRWEERRLMYPIGHCKRGTYLIVYFKGESLQTSLIRRELELNEQVLRHLILSCEEVPTTAYDAEAAFDESTLALEDTPPPPEPLAVQAEAGEAKSGDNKSGENQARPEKAEKAEKGEKADKAEKAPTEHAGGDKK